MEESANSDSRTEAIRLMGPVLGTLFDQLWAELEWLRRKRWEFQELFESGQERIDLLNRTAQNFFYFLHRLLFEDAIMHLSRLTDPPQTGTKQNLSLQRLPDAVSDLSLKVLVEDGVNKAVASCTFARRWRDRRLAHTDLKTSRGQHPSPLQGVTSEDVEEGLNAVSAVLKLIAGHFRVRPSVQLRDPFGARSLLYYLRQAEKLHNIASAYGVQKEVAVEELVTALGNEGLPPDQLADLLGDGMARLAKIPVERCAGCNSPVFVHEAVDVSGKRYCKDCARNSEPGQS